MTEERKQQIIEEQIELLVRLNEECEPEQVRLNCETIISLIHSLPSTRTLNYE